MLHYSRVGLLLWLIALALVSWTLSQMPLAEIGNTLAILNWTQWTTWALVNILVIVVGTARWRVLSHMLAHHIDFLQLLIIKQAGQTVSFITPGPQFGGEPLQIYWLYKRTGMAIHSAVLSLGMDRFYELWINFLMLMLGIIFLLSSSGPGAQPDVHNNWQQILWLMSFLLLLLSALALITLKQPALFSRHLTKLSARWLASPFLQQRVQQLTQKLGGHWQLLAADLQLAVATKKSSLFNALLLSLQAWALIVFEIWLVLRFFDITLDFSGLILILVAMRLALLLPLPGGIGTLEAAIFWSFQMLELSAGAALAMIALMRLRDILVLLAGLVCLRIVQTSPPHYVSD